MIVEELFILGAIGFVVYALMQGQNGAAASIDLSVSTPSDGSGGTDMAFSSGYQPSTAAQLLGRAIAVAEGFGIPGSRPTRDHNPGDMTADLIGRAVGKDGPFVVYANDDDGFLNLFYQVDEWLNGSSHHASPTSTIQQVSEFYTANDSATWANNVANHLGVPVDTPIGSIG